jgi:hypothetical protein
MSKHDDRLPDHCLSGRKAEGTGAVRYLEKLAHSKQPGGRRSHSVAGWRVARLPGIRIHHDGTRVIRKTDDTKRSRKGTLREAHMTFRLIALVVVLIISPPFAALAQNQTPSAAASSEQLLKAEELDALVAPIALYPDALLSLVLMASTYPLEVVQADRWAKEHKNLKGNQLKAEVDKQSWDDSVKSLVATPDVLSMMSSKLDWTQKLGDAVLAQQPDVMDAIQRLREKAETNKKLTSTKQQKVVKKQEQGKQSLLLNQQSQIRFTSHTMILR